MPVPSSLNLQPEANDKAKDTTPEETSRPSSPASPDSPRSTEDLQQNKLFVGALNSETTEDKLKVFFSQYGDVLECSLMRDQSEHNRSRGFAFITFKEPESVKTVLDSHSKEPLKIDNKTIDPKLAVPRQRNKVRRIFVGGLSSDTDEEDMQEFFEQFGIVEEVQLMYDRNTNRHRGFGFVTFEKPGPAEKVCSIQFHDIKGKKVEVKVAQTKEALALQAGKAKTASPYSHGGYGMQRHASSFNYSPPYSPFYPPPYPLDLYGPQFIMGGGKPRGNAVGGGANKMRMANQYSPPAFFGGYSYPPSEHNGGHITSPQYFPGFGSLPSPFFIRPDPSLPLSSPPVDFIEQFQAMTMMGNPYSNMSSGSPPTNLPLSVNNSSFNYQNGEAAMNTNYSPPSGISPKGSPTSTPVNGYSQVPNSFTPAGKASYPAMQQTSA